MSTANLLLPGTRKFRENSADSVTYHLSGHTATNPRTITISRTLPTPRKGNPGTCKIAINARNNVTLDVTKPTERVVPVIFKCETSVPVGANIQALEDLFWELKQVLDWDSNFKNEQSDLFTSGMLPDENPTTPDPI